MAKAWGIEAGPVVRRIYRQILEREVDDCGLIYFGAHLSAGSMSVAQVIASIVHSPEYEQRFVREQPAPIIVADLYWRLLGRAPDPGGNGAAGHQHRLGQIGFHPVVDAFLTSNEYQQRFGDDGVPEAPKNSR